MKPGPKPKPFTEHYEVDPVTGCWIWTGLVRARYGAIWMDGKMMRAHRLSYEIYTGTKIPKGKHVLHDCDNPLCVNPKHLRLGTNQDNVDDRNRKERQARGNQHGLSKLTKEQVIEIRNRTESQRNLAEEYGVHHRLICKIKRREIWRHV